MGRCNQTMDEIDYEVDWNNFAAKCNELVSVVAEFRAWVIFLKFICFARDFESQVVYFD